MVRRRQYYYHAIPTAKESEILKGGLKVPKDGRTTGSRVHPGVYLFSRRRDAENYYRGLYNLGSIPVRARSKVLRVKVPKSHRLVGDPEYKLSFVDFKSISKSNIKVIGEGK